MTSSLQLHTVTREQFEAADDLHRWHDPEQLLQTSPSYRATILDNPLLGGGDSICRLIAVHNERVVGKTDFLAGKVAVDGVWHPMLWSSSTIVSPTMRRRGVGTALASRKRHLAAISGTCGVSSMHVGVYHKLAWVGHDIPRYLLPLKARPIVHRYMGSGHRGALITPFADSALAILRRMRRAANPPVPTNLSVRKATSPPPELDEPLSQPTKRITPHRSRRWLEWLTTHSFNTDPRDQQHIYIISGSAGDILAYFVTKIRFHAEASHRRFPNVLLGSLQDWRIFKPCSITLLHIVVICSDILAAHGCDAIEVCVKDPHLKAPLGSLGFYPFGALQLFFGTSDSTDISLSDIPGDEWEMHPAEGDNYFS